MINIVNKEDIIKLTGYSESQSKKLIREAKRKLVTDGFYWYNNKRVGRVPLKTIEELLGFELTNNHAIIEGVQEDTATRKGV